MCLKHGTRDINFAIKTMQVWRERELESMGNMGIAHCAKRIFKYVYAARTYLYLIRRYNTYMSCWDVVCTMKYAEQFTVAKLWFII